MACSRLSVQGERERELGKEREREREIRGGSGVGEEREIISSLSPFSFCSSRLNESHKGDNFSGYLSGTFAFAHGTNPGMSFSPFEKGGKRGTYNWLHPASTGGSFVTRGFGDLPS